MKRFLIPIVCILALAGCRQASQAPAMTPRIHGYNVQGLPGPDFSDFEHSIFDHYFKVKDGWMQPWLDYDSLMVWSMNFLMDGPLVKTEEGLLAGYLVTASYEIARMVFPELLTQDRIWGGNLYPNNQGGNAYFAMKLFRYYYPYTGDIRALVPVKNLLDRMLMFLTPDDWAWPAMVRTQDNEDPDGIYMDELLEPDKAAMAGIAYMDYAQYSGEQKYQAIAEHIAQLLVANIKEGSDKASPLPFRLNMRTGEVEDPYTSNMIFVVEFFDKILASDMSLDMAQVKAKRDLVFDWIMEYPMKTDYWSGYFEDIRSNHPTNINQFSPMETARYLLANPDACKDYKQLVLDLLALVKGRFGGIVNYGGVSIKEQDACYYDMGSHTARYGSVLARWARETGCEQAKNEALATLALAEYSAYNHTSKGNIAVNSTGMEWAGVWYSDSYFDYLPHFFEGMVAFPEIIPEGTDHIFSTSCMLKDVQYGPGSVRYTALEPSGTERLKLSFTPKVLSGGKPLPKSAWSFGRWNDCAGILTINRKDVTDIEIVKE